jgi:hypothetical protein
LWNIGVSSAAREEEAVTTLCGLIGNRKNILKREKKENRKTIG